MAMTSKEFLKKFFNIHRLNDMQDNDYERWVRFEDFVSKDNMTTNMAKWAGYLEKDPADPNKKTYLRQPAPNGFFKIQDYPNIEDLSDEDLEKLFLACQHAFVGLHKNKDAYIDEAKVYNFINHYYDMFASKKSSMLARKETETQINGLKKFLSDILKKRTDPNVKHEAKSAINSIIDKIESVFRNSSEFRTLGIKGFIDKLGSQDYNKDDKFQELLQNVARLFNKYSQNNIVSETKDLEKSETSLQAQIVELRSNNIFQYGAWLESEIDAAALDKFKREYSGIFKDLYKEQKIFDAFKQHEGEDKQISAAIEKTKTDMDYANPESKDYVAPKREDELTVPQQIKKWASNTYSDYFAKYSKFKGDRVFLDETSGSICKALDKAELKPTDGLKKLLENEKKIKTSLQNDVKAREAFEWMSKTLNEIKDDPDMTNAFNGALKYGHQMKKLVKEIIIKAAEADDPKITAKAKITLEVLSVIKYGNTTSRIMDSIKGDKDLFKLLSNKDLSWNKNAGVQFITTAMDGAVKTAFLGVSYGATFFWNMARKSGSKFNQQFKDGKNDKTGERMKQASEAWDQDHDDAKQALIDQQNNAKAARAEQEAKRNATKIGDEAGLKAKEDKLKQWEAARNRLEIKTSPIDEQIQTYTNLQTIANNFEFLEWQKNAASDAEIKNQFSAKQADLLAQLQQYQYDLSELGFNIGDPSFDMSALSEAVDKKLENLSANPEYLKNLDKLNKLDASISKSQEAIEKYKKATKEIEALTSTIDKDQKKIDSWDDDHRNVYDELMAHWDFLETGRDSHTGPLYTRRLGSAKKNQQRLNPKAVALLNKFRGGYHAQ